MKESLAKLMQCLLAMRVDSRDLFNVVQKLDATTCERIAVQEMKVAVMRRMVEFDTCLAIVIEQCATEACDMAAQPFTTVSPEELAEGVAECKKTLDEAIAEKSRIENHQD